MKFTFLLISSALVISCGKNTTEGDTVTVPLSPVANNDLPASAMTKVDERNTTGKITVTGYTMNGKKAGSWVEYFDSGLPKTITSYYDGKKEGLYLEFNVSNQIVKECFYSNDQRHGQYKEYYGAMVKEERTYVDGKLEGTVRIFYDTGKIMEEGLYQNGVRNGVSKWYDQNGNLSIEYVYAKGELVKK